mmetsp:Transcript_93958/g.223595  ORF Transcript_93958/g.223595 Transcript_93958/m.223595 type:complete len:221 (-) Transcript_93958:83-745(-)
MRTCISMTADSRACCTTRQPCLSLVSFRIDPCSPCTSCRRRSGLSAQVLKICCTTPWPAESAARSHSWGCKAATSSAKPWESIARTCCDSKGAPFGSLAKRGTLCTSSRSAASQLRAIISMSLPGVIPGKFGSSSKSSHLKEASEEAVDIEDLEIWRALGPFDCGGSRPGGGRRETASPPSDPIAMGQDPVGQMAFGSAAKGRFTGLAHCWRLCSNTAAS